MNPTGRGSSIRTTTDSRQLDDSRHQGAILRLCCEVFLNLIELHVARRCFPMPFNRRPRAVHHSMVLKPSPVRHGSPHCDEPEEIHPQLRTDGQYVALPSGTWYDADIHAASSRCVAKQCRGVCTVTRVDRVNASDAPEAKVCRMPSSCTDSGDRSLRDVVTIGLATASGLI
jgi:hypothetical protein